MVQYSKLELTSVLDQFGLLFTIVVTEWQFVMKKDRLVHHHESSLDLYFVNVFSVLINTLFFIVDVVQSIKQQINKLRHIFYFFLFIKCEVITL